MGHVRTSAGKRCYWCSKNLCYTHPWMKKAQGRPAELTLLSKPKLAYEQGNICLVGEFLLRNEVILQSRAFWQDTRALGSRRECLWQYFCWNFLFSSIEALPLKPPLSWCPHKYHCPIPLSSWKLILFIILCSLGLHPHFKSSSWAFKRRISTNLHKLFQNIEEKGALPNSFY